MELWYFDRSGGLGSRPFDFAQDWNFLVRVILAIGSTTREEELGFKRFLPPRSSKIREQFDIDLTLRVLLNGDEKYC